ncbi:hypothetical protein [Tenacibaculum aiptasiae]|uniref:hypothetical protein n=1 Tax=Tenacibaculum aiptasiae TaxID=426481 RepID=UPI003B5CD37F
MTNKKQIIRFIFFIFLFTSCHKKISEKQAWNNFFNGNIEVSNTHFKELIKNNPSSKKNYLGLAYTQCIANKEYMPYIKKFTNNNDSILMFSHIAGTLKQYFSNDSEKKLREHLKNNLEIIKSLHLDSSFKTYHLNGNIESQGQYKKMRAIGIWKSYSANGKLIEEVIHPE